MKRPVVSTHSRHGFTLIELLVVIAIIAILAAILFPVFAQARAKARQATCISNSKQLALATMMYVQDYDETYPEAFGWDPALGWETNYFRGIPGTIFGPQYTDAMNETFSNSTQPYIKNYGVLDCPEAAKQGGGYAGVNPNVRASLSYNGLLQSYPEAGIVTPASLPMLTESQGKGYYQNADASDPVLFCNNNADLTCVYRPATDATCSGGANGGRSGWYTPVATMDVHSKGQTYAYSDGHAKFKRLSIDTVAPGLTAFTQEPWAQYNPDGTPVAPWGDQFGCHLWYFRPDYNFP